MTRAASLLLAVVAGCVSLPDFAESYLVDRPRVLAVVSEPPEIHPGQSAELSLMLAGVGDHSVRWRACGAFFAMFSGASAQYGDGVDDQGCAEGGELTVELGEGETAVLPGDLSSELFASLALAEAVLGSALPEGTVDKIRERVGLPILIEASVQLEDRTLRAVKRVLVSEQPEPHHNPPPPHFELGEREIVSVGDFRCEAADGEPLRVDTGEALRLAPILEGDSEDWLERYAIIDATGRSDERDERAYYSWFVDAGRLNQDLTRSPLRNNVLHTPDEPGRLGLWLVMRDGHGGTSGCGMELMVGR